MTTPLTRKQEPTGCPSCHAVCATWITNCENPIHAQQANAYIHKLEDENERLKAVEVKLTRANEDCESWYVRYEAIRAQLTASQASVTALEKELNTPEVIDFAKAVNLEAAHQRARWGTDHDGGKTDADWFWLVGYLVGKALHLPDKRLHHLVTAAAALANWHLYTVGKEQALAQASPTKEGP